MTQSSAVPQTPDDISSQAEGPTTPHLKAIAAKMGFFFRSPLPEDQFDVVDGKVVHLSTEEALARDQAQVAHAQAEVASLADDPQMWPGRRGHGPRWHEAVATAVQGPWVNLQDISSEYMPHALDRLRSDARAIHRQLLPIGRRKVSGERLLSLDYVIGDGMTIHDVLQGAPDPHEMLFGVLPDHPQINAVLGQLDPLERAVAVAYANPRTMPTWTEAAWQAATTAPEQFAGVDVAAFGERVRRKLRRMGTHRVDQRIAGRGPRGEEA
ncbi:hypothetical protein [Streptomyces arenae]|uniref:hypothetical protein n=1 Tax=Streptomyces arenae TaxID=29301 RepID=UPI002658B26E|nr:hypothetical protein [Streptomyces arenae]MCG7202291.1 hypothetical protein [Streptomyces arenae]